MVSWSEQNQRTFLESFSNKRMSASKAELCYPLQRAPHGVGEGTLPFLRLPCFPPTLRMGNGSHSQLPMSHSRWEAGAEAAQLQVQTALGPWTGGS